MNKYADALKYFIKALEIKEKISPDVETDLNIASIFHEISCCYYFVEKYAKSVEYSEKSLLIKKSNPCHMKKDQSFAFTLLVLGSGLSKKRHFRKAQICLDKALKICKNEAIDDVYTLQWMGYCLSDMNKQKKALTYFNKSLKITINLSLDVTSDRGVAYLWYELGRCHTELKELKKANCYFGRMLEMLESTSYDDIKLDQGAARIYYQYGH